MLLTNQTKKFMFIILQRATQVIHMLLIAMMIVIKILYDKDLSFIKDLAQSLKWNNHFNFNMFQKLLFGMESSVHRVDQFHVVLPLLENKLPQDICNKIYEFYVMDL